MTVFEPVTQWIETHPEAAKLYAGLAFAIVTGGWVFFNRVYKPKPKDDETPPPTIGGAQFQSGSVETGGGPVVQPGGNMVAGGDIHIGPTRDPEDDRTIRNLNNHLEVYRNQLAEQNVTLAEQNALIGQLRGALQVAQTIETAGGPLADRARELLDDFAAGRIGNAAIPAFDALIAEYRVSLKTAEADLVQLYLGRGALSFLHDTQGALNAFQEAARLDPENMEAHNQVGHLEQRLGNLAAAEQAYSRVLDLALAQDHKGAEAAALGNLGNLAQTRGDLDAAESYYQQALALNQELGSKAGMASDYGNLGALAKTRGDLDAARGLWDQSRDLFEDIGMPHMVEKVQGWIDEAAARD